MKGRDSGMPEADYWNSFFDAECIIRTMFDGKNCEGNIVEFGSGYGTFTFPAAKYSTGTVFALDIESDLVERLQKMSEESSIRNIHVKKRDFVVDGTGLETETQSHAMIYNLLHLEQPVALLQEAHRVLHKDGKLSVIHWRSDITTPRGPALNIRPTIEQCKAWLKIAGFNNIQNVDLHKCCQFHYGIVAHR
jgi:ubiquinone/menaquinone biosynthesis C-methylase UbiE